MPIVAPIEKFYMEKLLEKGLKEGLEKGHKEGLEKGRKEGLVSEAQASVVDILNDRFGKLPSSLRKALNSINDLSVLRNLRKQALKVNSLEAMNRFIQEGK